MIPISLTLENFASHTRSHLDFTQFNAALLVGAHDGDPDRSNGSGKSSIFAGICYALFGKTKFSAKERIVRRGTSSCSAEFVFQLSDGQYKVIRKLDNRSNISDVTFYRLVDGEWDSKPYTGDTNTITTKNIISKLGVNYDAFVNVIYFQQNDIAGFAAAQTGVRKSILQDILQIGVWEDCQKEAKKERDRLVNERDALVSRINGFGNLEEEKIKNADLIANSRNNIQVVQDQIVEIENQIHENEEEISNIEITISKSGAFNRQRLEEKIELIKNAAAKNKERKELLKQKIKNNNETIVKSNGDIQQLELNIFKLSKDVMAVEGEARKDIENLLIKMSKVDVNLVFESPTIRYKEEVVQQRECLKEQYQNTLNELMLQLRHLLALTPGKECPTCLTDIINVDEIKDKRKEKQDILEKQISEVQADVSEIAKLINEEKLAIQKGKQSYMEIQRYGLMIAKHQTSINEATRHNGEIQEELIRLKEEWETLKDKKNKADTLLEQTGNVDEAQKHLDGFYQVKKSLLGKLENLRKMVIEHSVCLGNLEGYEEELNRRISEKTVLTSQRDVVSADVEAYCALVRIFGKEGIQAIIMENMTDDLRTYANATLQHLSSDPMSINFVTQRQTIDGSWKEDFDINIVIGNEVYDFKDLSGGEQVRVAFALRLALSKILMRRVGSSIKFLLLDEVDQSLDKYGVEVLAQTIRSLTDEFKIVIITHNEHMKEKFDHIITVQKGPNGSVIRQ